MHARLIRFTVADPEKGTRENAQQTIRDRVIPTLSEYDGFAGYLAFMDKDRTRARAVILWDSEEHAEAAEQTLAERRREMASGVGLSVESTELYEAIAVEVPATAHV
jgi:hypothetical protein